MRPILPVLTGLSVLFTGLAPISAGQAAVPLAAPAITPAAAPAAAPRTEKMTHRSCESAAKAKVSVTWTSKSTARVSWRLEDMRRDGRNPAIRIVGLDHNGAEPALKQDFFGDDGIAHVTRGVGHDKSGERMFKPRLEKLDEIEVWIWTSRRGDLSYCGYNITKRINDVLHSPARTAPTSYRSSKAVRDRIVAAAWAQHRTGYRESGANCNKYNARFQSPNVCQAWCAVFAWWVWTEAGVPGAKLYNSSYTDDFQDEWQVRFKPTGGKLKPAKGDVVVWSHRIDGTSGHVGVVVATRGWNVRVVQGNWGDAVTSSGWIDPFTSRQANGNKRVIGFASPV